MSPSEKSQVASPVAAMQLRKDGGFHTRSDAQPADALAARLDLARRTILLAGEGILGGVIDVSPLLEKKTLACQKCEFGTLCRFEPIFNRPRVAERSLPTLEQDVADDSGGAA